MLNATHSTRVGHYSGVDNNAIQYIYYLRIVFMLFILLEMTRGGFEHCLETIE